MLQPLIDVIDVLTPGWIRLPSAYARTLGAALEKGLSHRYIRRVPTGKVTKTGKMRYRYYYHAAHGGTVGNEDHYVVGASFKDDKGHWHITGREGDKLTLKHDETGEERAMTSKELREHLVGLHKEAIAGAQARARQDIADARASGASKKQIARLNERAIKVGVDARDDFEAETDALPELRDRDQDVASRRASTREGRDFFRNAKVGTEVETPKGNGRVVGFNHAGTMMVKTAGGEVNIYTAHVDASPGSYRISGATATSAKDEGKPDRAQVLAQIKAIEHEIDPYGINTVRPVRWTPMVARDPKRYAELRAKIHALEETIGQRPWQRTKEQMQAGMSMPESKHREIVVRALAEGKPVPTEVLAGHPGAAEEAAAPKPVDYAADIPLDMAQRAHAGTSFDPEKRGKQERESYAGHLTELRADLAKHETPDNASDIQAAFDDYRRGYAEKTKALLSAKSRTMSSMITGPARFPVASNQKKLDTERARMTEMLEWSKTQRARIMDRFNPATPTAISSDRFDAADALSEKLASLEKRQEMMVAANKVYRSKLSDDAKVEKLKALGLSEATARLGLKPDFAGRIGFADYATKNNAAEIRRLKDRIGAVQSEAVKPTTEHEFAGGRVVDDADANRVRIYHDSKPSADVIAKLKSSGFKWSPSEGAWQRQRNNAARYAAGVITGAAIGKGTLTPLIALLDTL